MGKKASLKLSKRPLKIRHFVLLKLPYKKFLIVAAAVLVGAIGSYYIVASSAETFVAATEAESGELSSADMKRSDTAASGGVAVRFGVQSTAGRNVAVSTSAELTAALANALPDDVITLSDGTYSGHFNSVKSGTSQAPITLTGSRNAIIDGGPLDSGYTFSLGVKNDVSAAAAVSYWKIIGLTVTGGQKGIVFDNVQHSTIDDVLIQNIGEEGIHLRANSSNNVVQNSTITKTGQVQQAFGEGVYIGSAVSNWGTVSQGAPDHSNSNRLLGNTISLTGAENIDVKEGTHAGVITGNHLDGTGMCYNLTADCNSADSLIDIKGEGWTVIQNTGNHMHVTWVAGGQSNDGFQVHVTANTGSEGSGSNNVFKSNTLDDLDGYGFNIQSSATGTLVSCSNNVTNATKGFGNLTCQQ